MKKIYIKTLVACLLLLNIATIYAQCVTGSKFSKTNPKRDLRGVFVAAVFNLNWPTNRSASAAVQQAELITI